MATVTILKRASGKTHLQSVIEGTDTAALSSIQRTSAGAATLWDDVFTTAITIGAAGTPVTVDDSLTVSGVFQGPNDGTGIVIGHAGAAASQGSAPQLVSLTATEIGYLVPADGMMIYNESAAVAQIRVNGSWEEFPSTAEQGEQFPGEHLLGGVMNYPSSGGLTSSEIQYTRIRLIAGQVFDTARTFIASGGSAARSLRMGLYDQVDPTSATGTPDTRVAETNSFTTGGLSGYQEFAFATPTTYSIPTSGFYWVAIIVDSSALSFASSAAYRADYAPVYRETGTGTTLPATVGTITNPAGSIAYASVVEQ